MANEQGDLRQALLNFKSDMEGLHRFNAIDNASQIVQQIRSSSENEANKRNALQGVANDLVLRLAASNTPATTLQAVAGAAGPRQFKTAEEAILEGQLSGKPEMTQQGQEAQAQALAPQQEFQSEEKALDRQLARELAMIKSGTGKPVSAAFEKKIGATDDLVDAVDELMGRVEKNSGLVGAKNIGPGGKIRDFFSSTFGEGEFSDFRQQVERMFLSFATATTGAQRGFEELKGLRSAMPNENDNVASFKRKLDTLKKAALRTKNRALKFQLKAGKNVAGFDTDNLGDLEDMQTAVASPGPTPASATPFGQQALKTIRMKDASGKVRTYQQRADGKINPKPID